MNYLKRLKNNVVGFFPLITLFVLVSCGKQGNIVSFDENLQSKIEYQLEVLPKRYKAEFEILNNDSDEIVKISEIGKVVGSIRYKTRWSERIFGREFSGNNIPFHRYNDNLNKDIKVIKKLIRSVRRVKNTEDFSEFKKNLDNLLIKLKDIYFIVTKHKSYRDESRYQQDICNQKETQRRISYSKY